MLPKLIKIKQDVPAPQLKNISAEVFNQIKKLNLEKSKVGGKSIGITVGSRGIHAIDDITRAIVSSIKEMGGVPIIIPAMGSHGGASERGQEEVLASLGITETSVMAPIKFCASAVKIGETSNGIPVYCSEEAVKLDGLVIANRIKSHTDFTGDIESGLCKMMTIGLGNPKGADTAHYYAVNYGYAEMIRESAEIILEKLPVIFALGIVENWKNQTMKIEAILPENIIEKERELLKYYKKNSLKLPFKEADILIVGEMGKNISGAGMDTKVIGRIRILGQKEPNYPKINNIVVLDITEESHGNATGIGLADYTTMKVFKEMDINATTINGLTSMSPDQIRIPCILENDLQAIEAAIRTLGPAKENNFSMAYIKNTASLEEMAVTENIFEQINGRVEALEGPKDLVFNSKGKLKSPLE